jgi:hypothetical protein
MLKTRDVRDITAGFSFMRERGGREGDCLKTDSAILFKTLGHLK